MAEPRYKVIAKSQSDHCCFEATVVDTLIAYAGYIAPGETQEYYAICECFDVADAIHICDAMNASVKE